MAARRLQHGASPRSRWGPPTGHTVETQSTSTTSHLATRCLPSWFCSSPCRVQRHLGIPPARILAGQGLAGESVRIEEGERDLVVYYATKEIRRIPLDNLKSMGTM